MGIRPEGFSPSSRYSFRHSLFDALHCSFRYSFFVHPMLLYHSFESLASALCLSPGNFRRRTSRPVSCYALFECMAASEPTSWLFWRSHILYHLTHTWGPWLKIWAVSLLTAQLISCGLTPVHRLYGIRSALKLFRGEPAISGFDWNFSPTHTSSPPFSTDVRAALHRLLRRLQPGHG